MFRIRKKKAPFFHLAAAILACLAVSLASDLYLWEAVTENLFVDELALLFIVGGLMFTLHLCAMPFFDEEYDKVVYVLVIIEGILAFMLGGIILVVDALKNLRETVTFPKGNDKVYYFDGYRHVLSAGVVGLATSVVFVVELILYFVKPDVLE